ncbi:WYL domain-containing protein [Herbivorax sp. ANBcel31]|uniref:WYL domain-containing protein n=1 Tax=Herbivorax sp. ANBcel31 TaxID=3069754 RepID=UPI0027ADBD18|nr:WYL domain-containing protein [Herbivorax sp. ANBcel31]MDQ2087415.1 WYL domain-containing protein [Herbivorax sp. ANBcel31]
MKGQNKKERLEKIKDLIRRNNGATKLEISDKIGISIATTARDIKYLRDMGHKILCKSGRYKLAGEAVKPIKNIKYSMSQKRQFNLLWFISEKGFCTQKELKDFFTRPTKDDLGCEKSKICTKTLKKYLKNLMDQGMILYKCIPPKEGGYYLAEKQFDKEGIPVELCVRIIEFIRTNTAPLPFNNKLQTIVEKLENGIIRSIAGNDQYPTGDILDNVGLSYKIFTDGKDNDVTHNQEELLFELDNLCQNCSFAEIWTKGKDKPLKHFCLLTVCRVSLGCWYLVVKTRKRKRPYSLIRVDRIEKVNRMDNIKPDINLFKRIQSQKLEAYDDIVESFGMGLGGKVEIKLKLSSDKQITNNIITRLEDNIIEEQTVCNEDGFCVITVLIDGVSDFMHWIRGFGSKAVILEPEHLRNLQYEVALKTIENYQEAHDENKL